MKFGDTLISTLENTVDLIVMFIAQHGRRQFFAVVLSGNAGHWVPGQVHSFNDLHWSPA